MGKLEDQIILMLFPLGQDDRELDLEEYAYTKLQAFTDNLTLVEKETKVSMYKSVLSPDLQVISRTYHEEIPLFNHNISSQRTLIHEIADWRRYSSDWLYKQLKEFAGKTIFNVFDIPLEDLGSGNEKVFGLFGFKKSDVFSEEVPTIIFLQHQSGLSENIQLESIDSNAYNWSQPCPPFCATTKGYLLFDEKS
ncbi:hypothetical protein M8998_01585 [Sphingobacterium sp. lm-10]|uniref:hypothetical protein n=1 Tax=Sphingobacterium sp. lm-10 TaxID=2944904 RepID=UPI00202026B1|nr:hypothetical protein [Sphingobacterium sp. lm-10]MCL7986622.1 hypothetical protein [Sphingobacterium sp. lm-10]